MSLVFIAHKAINLEANMRSQFATSCCRRRKKRVDQIPHCHELPTYIGFEDDLAMGQRIPDAPARRRQPFGEVLLMQRAFEEGTRAQAIENK